MIKRKNDEKEKSKTGLGMLRRQVAFSLPVSGIAGIIIVSFVGFWGVALCIGVGLFTFLSPSRVSEVSPPVPTPFEQGNAPNPTPTAQFNSVIGMGGYFLITKEQVGVIPANTRVRVTEAFYNLEGWHYTIVMGDEKTTAVANESQLDYAPGVAPGPTPTAHFGNTAGYQVITTEQIGLIPPGTRVQIGSMRLGIDGWIYTIMMPDEKTFAEAKESQLAYAPGVTPGVTPAMKFSGEIGMGGYRMITIEQVGLIPKGTRVRISTARIGLNGWLYSIVGVDEKTFVDAEEWQITYAPDVIPGATPTNSNQ